MKIHLHLGVPKTATTSLQTYLQRNRRQLNDAGIGYIPLHKIREILRNELAKPEDAASNINEYVKEFFYQRKIPEIKGLIISDESIIGNTNTLLDTKVPVRIAKSKMDRLAKLFDGHELSIYLALRSYDTFFPSVYCEALLRGTKFAFFKDCMSGLNLDHMRWPFLMRRLWRDLKPTQLRIWRFEDFPANVNRIVSDLAFGFTAPDQLPEARRRSVFSSKSIAVLETIAQAHGPEVAAKVCVSVGNDLYDAEQHVPYAPFEAARSKELTRLYDEDCEAIRRKFWIVQPGRQQAKRLAPRPRPKRRRVAERPAAAGGVSP